MIIRNFCRFLYGGSLWQKKGKTPILHLVYDVMEKSLHHVCPSSVSADKTNNVAAENLKIDFENKISDLLVDVDRGKTLKRLRPLSKKLYSTEVTNNDEDLANTNEPNAEEQANANGSGTICVFIL